MDREDQGLRDLHELPEELGSEDYQEITRFTRNDVVGVGIVRQSRANELAVSGAVQSKLPEVQRALPDGVDVSVAVDFTIFVREALGKPLVWTGQLPSSEIVDRIEAALGHRYALRAICDGTVTPL